MSTFLAPCLYVGGKRFSFLSYYLSKSCDEYHVLARREKVAVNDLTAFRGNVHRVKMFPHYPPQSNSGIKWKLSQAWLRWFCLVDPYVGWIVPATLKGIALCKENRLNVVIVTVPPFSALIAATVVSKITAARLIIDYRDPWTNGQASLPKPFGKILCPWIERCAMKQASAIVFNTSIMRDDAMKAFRGIMPLRLEVVYSAFENYETDTEAFVNEGLTTMLYAGTFYGTRRLSIIATVLSDMLRAQEICATTFRLNLFATLSDEDRALIEELGIASLVEIHEPVPYDAIKKIMCTADILFLPSGEEVAYAVPFKFFDYLSVRRPILAVAPKISGVSELMGKVDCGEFAELGKQDDVARAFRKLLNKDKRYTFKGSEQFRWENSAQQYINVINNTLELDDVDRQSK